MTTPSLWNMANIAHRDTAGCECAPGETDQHNLVRWFIVCADKIIRLANVLQSQSVYDFAELLTLTHL